MPRRKIFGEEEIRRIISEYKSGMTLAQVAEKHMCTRQTVSNYVARSEGGVRHKGRQCKYNVPMLVNDWNSDKHVDSIVKCHGFTTRDALYSFIRHNRKKGFKYRSGVRRRKGPKKGRTLRHE